MECIPALSVSKKISAVPVSDNEYEILVTRRVFVHACAC